MAVDSRSSMRWIGWNVSGAGMKDAIGQDGKGMRYCPVNGLTP
jgi:hypothetical protein